MTDLITTVFSLFILALGCSCVVQARAWLSWAEKLVNEPQNILLLSVLLLPMGLVIVVGHNIWEWQWRVVVTLFGWIIVTKYSFYLLWPQAVTRFKGWLRADLAPAIRLAGIAYIIAGAASSWQALSVHTG